jgi:hypothetical protein
MGGLLGRGSAATSAALYRSFFPTVMTRWGGRVEGRAMSVQPLALARDVYGCRCCLTWLQGSS